MTYLLYILVFLLTFNSGYAQQRERIYVKDFKGLYTNGDPYDIDNAYLQEVEGLRPYNGRLLKTFGPTIKLNQPGTSTILNQCLTFMSNRIDSASKRIYLGFDIDATTNILTAYGWNESSTPNGWGLLFPVFDQWTADQIGTVYHKDDTHNPFVKIMDQLRVYPGNVNTPDGTNVAKAVIYNWIDRDFFDETFSPAAGFYGNVTNIDKPTFAVTLDSVAQDRNGSMAAGVYHYKYSYTYDGAQESLCSDPVSINLPDSNWVKVSFNIDTTTHNKRITAINVYRSYGDFDSYGLIHVIDLLRDDADRIRDATDGGYSSMFYVCVPGVADYAFPLARYVFRVMVDGIVADSIAIDSVSVGKGKRIFLKEGAGAHKANYWNARWQLWQNTFGSPDTKVDSGLTGFYCGAQVFLADTGSGGGGDSSAHAGLDFRNGIVEFDGDTSLISIDDYSSDYSAFKLLNDSITVILTARNNNPYAIMSPYLGLYYADSAAGVATINFFDLGLAVGESPPLEGEKHLTANGEFAVYIQDRIWQGNIWIAPGTRDSSLHEDCVIYSELGQYDVFPSSNHFHLGDIFGGGVTGIARMLGNPVVLMKNSINMIDVRSDPGTPSNWQVVQSAHSLGSVAHEGYIVVGEDLYVCSFEGIYQIKPNELAPYTTTPTQRLRISEPINDLYLALTEAQKEAIVVGYDQKFSELVYFFGNADNDIFLYNIVNNTWRKHTTQATITDVFTDENGFLLALYNDDVYTFNGTAAVNTAFKSKLFTLDLDIAKRVWNIFVQYKSATDTLSVMTYQDDLTTAWRDTLTISSEHTIGKVSPRGVRAKQTMIEITSPSSVNDVEINEIVIEYDR